MSIIRAIEVKIHNFRSIQDGSFELSPYSLLIGPNNAGKSNVMAAIRIFYEKGLKFEEQRDFPKFQTGDNESWVEIQFKPTAQEVSQLKEEYRLPDGTFRVRKYLKSNENDDEGKKKDGIYAFINGNLSGSRFYGAKNVQQGKLGDIIYIPAVSKLDEHTKLSGPSALRDLLTTVLKGILASSPSYKELASAFEGFGNKLKREQTPDGNSLELLEGQISSELEEWESKFEFLINPVQPEEIIKSLIEHKIVDSTLEKQLDPSAFGQGFQRHLIFTLIKLAANYEVKKGNGTKKDFSPELTWILFEEPEVFLHPSQIDVLDVNLRTFSQSEEQQVLICSHSSHFASLNVEDIPALVRVNKENSRTRIGQVPNNKLNDLLQANQKCLDELCAAGLQITNEDYQIDMESIKYSLWLNPLRSTAFFAQFVLLVEGPSETSLINYLIEHDQIRPSRSGICIIDTIGKWNTHRFVNLLGWLRINHAVLYDKDGMKATSIALENSIMQARNEYTICIDSFDIDLEEFLELPKTRSDRKPQHIMWYLTNGRIKPERLNAFCEKVQELLK